MRGRYLHNVDIPLPKVVEGAGLRLIDCGGAFFCFKCRVASARAVVAKSTCLAGGHSGLRPRGWRLSCRAAHRAELLGVVMRSGGDCCNERSTGQGSSAGRVRVCGVWRAVVAKTLLNSGKSTIIGGLRVRFEPLGMTDGDDTGTVFSFPQVTRLLWFFCGMASAGSRPSGRCNHRLSSIRPSLTPFFQQAGSNPSVVAVLGRCCIAFECGGAFRWKHRGTIRGATAHLGVTTCRGDV